MKKVKTVEIPSFRLSSTFSMFFRNLSFRSETIPGAHDSLDAINRDNNKNIETFFLFKKTDYFWKISNEHIQKLSEIFYPNNLLESIIVLHTRLQLKLNIEHILFEVNRKLFHISNKRF